MAKDKKKKKQSAESHKSSERQTSDSGAEVTNTDSAQLLNQNSAEQVDATDSAVEPTVTEITQSKVVDHSSVIEPVLTKLIIEEYVGEKEHGLYHGYGEAKFVGGHTYKGYFSEGKMHGNGVYTWYDGVLYEGDFTLNQIRGKGLYRWTDGSTYEGEVLNGLRHGRGTFTCPDRGLCYSGQWYKGKRHGEGVIYFDPAQQSFYEGEWFLNMKNGQGYRRYASGNVYQGMWYRDKRHGYGRMQWLDRNNAVYVGDWEHGLQHGYGEYTWFLRRLPGSQYPQRNRYFGQWYKGVRHGMGTFIYANGSRYKGPWQNNQKHGPGGTIIFRTGRVLQGEFKFDKMVDHPDLNIDQVTTPEIEKIKSPRPKSASKGGNFPDDVSIKSDGSFTAQANQINFVLNVDSILETFPEAKREEENLQIKFCVLRNISLLRKIYAFYAKLCKEPMDVHSSSSSEDNTFVLEKLQFWQLLKDCRINEHEVTLIEVDRIIAANLDLAVEGSPGDDDSMDTKSPPHQPNARMLFLDYVNALIYVAHHIFSRQAKEENCQHVLASSLTMLLNQRLSKYACKVSGSFMSDTTKAKVTFDYLLKVFEIYTFLSKPLRVPPRDFPKDMTMNARDVLHMLSEYNLLNDRLNIKATLQILAQQDARIYAEEDCNLELELTLLEFMECLLSFATIFVTDEILKEPRRSEQDRTAPQLTLDTGSGYPTHYGRASTLASHEVADLLLGQDLPPKTSMVTPSQLSQLDAALEEADEAVDVNNDGDAVGVTNEANTEKIKTEKKSGKEAETEEGTSAPVPEDAHLSPKKEDNEDAVQQSFKPGSEEDIGNGQDAALFGSRPLTRGASNMTSARSSRYVDWGGDTEDGMDDWPTEVKLWVQQVRCFFERKLLPAFHKALEIQQAIIY